MIDRMAVPSRTTTSIMIGGPDFKLKGVYLEDETMKPIKLEVREPNSEAAFELTIIGVMEQSAMTGFGLVDLPGDAAERVGDRIASAHLLHQAGGRR